MMFVKVYRYRIQPEETEKFLAIQERADQIYHKHVNYRAVWLRNKDDPGLWLEVHWYPDGETYRRAMDLIDTEPEIKELWQAFQITLDPNDPKIHEEYYVQVQPEDSLTDK